MTAAPKRIDLWRLEYLRLWRTRRWLAELAPFVAFGFIGPLSAKYLDKLIAGTTTGNLRITALPAHAADGVGNYAKNALGIGMLVTVVIAAAALSLDSRAGLSFFYRTRVRRARDLVLPRFAVVAAAAVVANLLGVATAWYETAVLIEAPDAAKMLMTVVLSCLYLVFAVSVTAAAATVARGVLGTVGWALAVMFVMPVLGAVPVIAQWLPTSLPASADDLLRGTHDASWFVPGACVAVVLSAALVIVAVWRVSSREV